MKFLQSLLSALFALCFCATVGAIIGYKLVLHDRSLGSDGLIALFSVGLIVSGVLKIILARRAEK